MLTCNGTVEVNDLKISTSNGDLVRFLEYRPKTATADNPVPAIVYSPGNDSTAESVRFALRNLHGVVMLYMFLICSLQVIPPKALAIHPPLALRN